MEKEDLFVRNIVESLVNSILEVETNSLIDLKASLDPKIKQP